MYHTLPERIYACTHTHATARTPRSYYFFDMTHVLVTRTTHNLHYTVYIFHYRTCILYTHYTYYLLCAYEIIKAAVERFPLYGRSRWRWRHNECTLYTRARGINTRHPRSNASYVRRLPVYTHARTHTHIHTHTHTFVCIRRGLTIIPVASIPLCRRRSIV